MKAIQIKEPKKLCVIDVEKPQVSEKNNVLVKIKAAGICGSDVGIYSGNNAAATYPRVIGHEMVGVIEELHESVKNFNVGDRVIINQVVSCGICYPCEIGRPNVCDNLKVRGVHIDGGFTEYMTVPEQDLYLLPDNMPFEEAVMIEPTSIGLQVCDRAELNEKDTLLIYGAGALGFTILKLARHIAKEIIVADIVEAKLQDALEQGAHHAINLKEKNLKEEVSRITNNRGVTVSMDAACTATSLLEIMEVTGNAGRVMALGFSKRETPINQFVIASKELDIRGSRLQNGKFDEAISKIKAGELDFKDEISHKFKLEEAQKAFDLIATGDKSIKKIVLVND